MHSMTSIILAAIIINSFLMGFLALLFCDKLQNADAVQDGQKLRIEEHNAAATTALKKLLNIGSQEWNKKIAQPQQIIRNNASRSSSSLTTNFHKLQKMIHARIVHSNECFFSEANIQLDQANVSSGCGVKWAFVKAAASTYVYDHKTNAFSKVTTIATNFANYWRICGLELRLKLFLECKFLYDDGKRWPKYKLYDLKLWTMNDRENIFQALDSAATNIWLKVDLRKAVDVVDEEGETGENTNVVSVATVDKNHHQHFGRWPTGI